MLTPQQISQAKSVASGGGITPSQSLTPEQAHAWINSSPGPSNPIGDVGAAFNSGIDKIKSAIPSAGTKPSPVQNIEGGLKVGAGLTEVVLSPLAPAMKPIGDLINEYAKWASSDKNPFMVGGAKAFENFANSPVGAAAERGAGDVVNASEIAQLVGAGPKVPEAAAAVGEKVASLKPEPVPPEVAAAKAAEADKANIQTRLNTIQKQWDAPITAGKPKNAATFAKASAIEKAYPGTTKFLTEQKELPGNNVVKGTYHTLDTGDAFREQGGKMSADILVPALKAADLEAPISIKAADAGKLAVKNIGKDPLETPGGEEAISSNIANEIAALDRKFPEGMNREQMQQLKSAYASKGKYKPDGDTAENNTAAMNRNMASAMQHLIEDNTKSAFDVKGFNKYISQYYHSADYLDALNNKPVPRGAIAPLLQRAAAVGGAVIGHGIGGGVLGGVGGYIIGGGLEHLLENATPTMRANYLANFVQSHPEAVTQVRDYIQSQMGGSPKTLRLAPEGGNPIPMGPESPPKVEGGVPNTQVSKEPTPLSVNMPKANATQVGQSKVDYEDSFSGFGSGQRFSSVRSVPIEEVIKPGRIAQFFNEAQTVKKYKESIAAGKPIDPIVIDEKGKINDGYHRLAALQSLGYKNVPVVFMEETLGRAQKEWTKSFPGHPFPMTEYLQDNPSSTFPAFTNKSGGK